MSPRLRKEGKMHITENPKVMAYKKECWTRFSVTHTEDSLVLEFNHSYLVVKLLSKNLCFLIFPKYLFVACGIIFKLRNFSGQILASSLVYMQMCCWQTLRDNNVMGEIGCQ